MKRRLGQFILTREMISSRHLEHVLPLFGLVAVVQCGLTEDQRCYQYVALSPEFDEIPLGEEIPTYLIEVTKLVNENGRDTFVYAFKREAA